MEQSIVRRVYESMACDVCEEFMFPGVDNAFTPDSLCMNYYEKALNAKNRILNKLKTDDDPDLALIFYYLDRIQEEVCFRMYHYGAQFGLSEE